MTAVVFVGPSLPRAEVEAHSDAVVLPPAAVGDVYRAARQRPHAIGLIDGYFDGVPSVWHKEILWAIQEGIPVFGGSSMGALRAAELHPFGMRGVGRIFEWFRDGMLEDDDEVAVLHGPAETGYLALSEPMVNFRATLEQAAAQQVIGAETHDALVGVAKRLFYQERSWDAVFDDATTQSLADDERAALRDWLAEGRVDVKRADALAVLAATADAEPATPPEFHLEWTTMWDKAVAFVADAGHVSESADEAHILDELRLDGARLDGIRDAAMLRLLAEREADREGPDLDRAALLSAMDRFRADRGLYRRADLDRWLADNDMTAEAFDRLMAQQAWLEWARAALARDLDDWLLGAARLSGAYPTLAARARDKQRVLAAQGSADPAGLSPLHVRVWYFETRLGGAVPDDIDAYVRALGFADRDAFDRAVTREYLYARETAGG